MCGFGDGDKLDVLGDPQGVPRERNALGRYSTCPWRRAGTDVPTPMPELIPAFQLRSDRDERGGRGRVDDSDLALVVHPGHLPADAQTWAAGEDRRTGDTVALRRGHRTAGEGSPCPGAVAETEVHDHLRAEELLDGQLKGRRRCAAGSIELLQLLHGVGRGDGGLAGERRIRRGRAAGPVELLQLLHGVGRGDGCLGDQRVPGRPLRQNRSRVNRENALRDVAADARVDRGGGRHAGGRDGAETQRVRRGG